MTKESSPFSNVHHVGIIVRDIDKTAEYYKTFGIAPFEPVRVERKEAKLRGKPIDVNLKVRQVRTGPIRFEFIQPVEGREYPWMQFLETKGEGIHHIAFVVDDIDKEIAKLAEKGVTVLYRSKYFDGGGATYLETDKVGGVIFELFQRPAGYVPSVKEETMAEKSLFPDVWQVGTVVRDLDKTVEYYKSLGIGPWSEGPSASVIDTKVYGRPIDVKVKSSMGHMGQMLLEPMQPIEGQSVQMEFLKSRGEGGIHINSHTNDIDKGTAELAKKGLKVISSGRMPGRKSGQFAYFDTREFGGVIFELEQL